jgi:hypothetical protein
MRPRKATILFFLGLAGFALPALADSLNLTTEQKDDRVFLTTSVESLQFVLPGGEIDGTGVKLDFSYAINDYFSMDIYLSTAFNFGVLQSSFTGLGTSINYTLWGDCCSSRKVVSIDGVPVVTEKKPLGGVLQVGLTGDQFFLNGSKSVYSAAGVGVGATYDFNLYKYRFRVGARRSALTANEINMTATFYTAGIVWPF